jgi:hypothetical protein
MSPCQIRLGGVVLCALLGAAAAAALEVGRSRVLSEAGVRLDYDSNIYANQSEVDDMILGVNAGTRIVRDASVLTTELGVSALGLIFADHSEENTFDPGLDLRLGYAPSEKTELKAFAEYRRVTMANDALSDRTQSNDLTLSASWQHLTTEKLGVRLSGDYRAADYRTPGYSDPSHYRAGIDGIYLYSPKLRLLAGASYGEAWTDNRVAGRRNPGGRDARFSAGFEGELASKITGNFLVGVTRREFAVAAFGTDTALFLQARLAWAAAEKTVWTLQLNQGLNVSAADQSVENFDASVIVTHGLSERVAVEASAGVTRAHYSAFGGAGARRDRGVSARARLNYTLTEALVADASVGYRDNHSSLALSDYDQLNLGAGISYRF